MSAVDPVQAVAEAMWKACDDGGIDGRLFRSDAEFLAEIAVAAARPLIAAEAWDEGHEAGWWACYFEDDEPTTNPYRAALATGTTTDQIEHDARCKHPKCPGGSLCCCQEADQ